MKLPRAKLNELAMLRYAGRARTMPFYRTYVLDSRGQVVVALDLECVDDDEAVARARRLGDSEVELWRRIPLLERERRRRCLEP